MAQFQGDLKYIGNYSYYSHHCIGEGAFGKVYKGKSIKTGEDVAIKKLDVKMFQNDKYLKQSIKQEIEILKKFNHVNIVRFIDLMSTENALYIITEFCNDGDLREMLQHQRLSEGQAIGLMQQILNGFKELVKNGIIHRDLKPANILIQKGVMKIAELQKILDSLRSLLRTCVGSPLYMAPQILCKKQYTTKCDVWSMGIIFYEMIFNDVPWNGRDEQDLLKNIQLKPLEFKKQISKFSSDILKSVLAKEEGDRVGWDTLFQMFDQYGSNSDLMKPSSNNSQKKSSDNVNDILNAQLRYLNQWRQEQGFRHFVNIEMFQRLAQCKIFYIRELSYEIFCALFSKIILTQSKQICIVLFLYLIVCFNQAEAVRPGVKQHSISYFQKEHEFHKILHEDIRDFFTSMGLLSNMYQNDENFQFKQFYENELNDVQAQQLEEILYKRAISLIKESLEEFAKKNTQDIPQKQLLSSSMQFLTLNDYLLNVFMIRKKLLRNQEVDLSEIHSEIQKETNPRKYAEQLYFKLRSVQQL